MHELPTFPEELETIPVIYEIDRTEHFDEMVDNIRYLPNRNVAYFTRAKVVDASGQLILHKLIKDGDIYAVERLEGVA